MNVELLEVGYCPRRDLLVEAALRDDNYPIVMLGDRIDYMVFPGRFGDHGILRRVLWSSHIGKWVLNTLQQVVPDGQPVSEIDIELKASPDDVRGDWYQKCQYYTVGIRKDANVVEMQIYAADLWHRMT